LFNISYALGAAIAPILGGSLYDKFKFRMTTDIMAGAGVSFSFVFFLFGVLPKICYRGSKKQN